jgi:hypothetical protein
LAKYTYTHEPFTVAHRDGETVVAAKSLLAKAP